VYAVFSGTNFYYSSQATAAFAVDEPEATATPQPTQLPKNLKVTIYQNG